MHKAACSGKRTIFRQLEMYRKEEKGKEESEDS